MGPTAGATSGLDVRDTIGDRLPGPLVDSMEGTLYGTNCRATSGLKGRDTIGDQLPGSPVDLMEGTL